MMRRESWNRLSTRKMIANYRDRLCYQCRQVQRELCQYWTGLLLILRDKKSLSTQTPILSQSNFESWHNFQPASGTPWSTHPLGTGSVSKVEMDCDYCHTGSYLRSLPEEG